MNISSFRSFVRMWKNFRSLVPSFLIIMKNLATCLPVGMCMSFISFRVLRRSPVNISRIFVTVSAVWAADSSAFLCDSSRSSCSCLNVLKGLKDFHKRGSVIPYKNFNSFMRFVTLFLNLKRNVFFARCSIKEHTGLQ